MSNYEKIRKVVIESFQNVGVFLDPQEEDININDYNLDSITYISFIVELEKNINLEIPDEYLLYDNFTSLNGFVNMILTLLV